MMTERECCVENPEGRSLSDSSGQCFNCIGKPILLSFVTVLHGVLQSLAGLPIALLEWRVTMTMNLK